MAAVRRCVQEYMAEGAVEKIDVTKVKTLNPLTMVVKPDPTKPSGLKERLCIDVSRKLNPRIPLRGFEMVTIRPHFKAFRKGIWMAKIDLKNGYFHIKVAPHQQGHLAFRVDNEYYCFTRQPFGINMLPFVFQLLMNESLRPLVERQSIIAESYLDDIWIQEDTPSELRRTIKTVTDHLRRLGFLINEKKSVLEPTQVMEYLGVTFDSKLGCIRIPTEKREKGLKLLSLLIDNPTLRNWQRLVGFLEFLTHVVHEGKAHLTSLFANYARSTSRPSAISVAAHSDLEWWRRRLQSSATHRPVLKPIDVMYESDASAIGGGLTCVSGDSDEFAIEWDREDTHSNIRELDMVRLLLEQRGDMFRDRHIHVRLDNTSSVSVVNKGGSSSVALNRLARLIWSLRHKYRVHLSASFIPGRANVRADALSRRKGSPVIEDDTTSVTTNVTVSKYVPTDPETCGPMDPRELPRLAFEGLGVDPLRYAALARPRFSSGYRLEQRTKFQNPSCGKNDTKPSYSFDGLDKKRSARHKMPSPQPRGGPRAPTESRSVTTDTFDVKRQTRVIRPETRCEIFGPIKAVLHHGIN